MKIAIIDTLGLSYDGSTLEKRGLGGSESAVVYISRELVKHGFEVTVFNDCTSDDSNSGVYDGVSYQPIQALCYPANSCVYDIVISSRSVHPFDPEGPYAKVMQNAKHKVLWMHDTFCSGDDLIEQYINRGLLNEIFTLTDWHTSYVTNCDHGFRRNFDVLKNHIFQTRNGVGVIPEWVDITQKDPNLFVYNASVTKGMIPLVTKVWPRIKAQFPQAKLKVIGGFYRFREDHGPDQQEKDWHQLVADHPEVDFTGIITQKEISDIFRKASYMLYPSAFPETFGISTLEAILHNVTPITCRFGALEETALDIASYKINYTVEKNWACPWLDEDNQIDRFVDAAIAAINNPYLHQQKMYACNQTKGICGWYSVALQWKQHFYRVLGEYLPINEHRAAQDINYRVAKVFGRRFVNPEMVSPPKKKEKHIQIVTPVYNAEKYIAKCMQSVAAQDYDDWEMSIIDDASTDDTLTVIYNTIDEFPREIQEKFYVIENKINRGAVYNQFHSMNHLPDTINMLLDGDDWLVNNPDIFNMYNNLYHDGAEFTYGSCWSLADNIPLIAQEYPPEVMRERSYRNYRFNWNMPYTHLRTFSSSLVHEIETSELKDENGEWYRAGGDGALFYALIEKTEPEFVVAVPEVVYVYNDTNPLNDYKINSDEQTKNAEKIRTDRFISKGFKGVSIIKAEKNDNTYDIINSEWPAIEAVIIENVSDWSVCVQAGGHHGTYPKRLAKLFKEVYTFEPDLTNFNVLKHNCTESNIKCYNKALSSYSKRVDIESVADGNSGQKHLITGDSIEAVTVDSLNLPSCGLLQLDVERHELFVLIGAIRTVEKYKPVIILEGPETTNNTCNLILEQLGYEMVGRAGYDSAFKYTGKESPTTEYKEVNKEMKKILIAIPCKNDIEADTFKSIYDLIIPEGYKADFQYFYGYAVDQVRNLIADWVIKDYDYLFAVDHDMAFPPDTLARLLDRDVSIIGGLYVQRLDPPMPEAYDFSMVRLRVEDCYGVKEVGGIGMGCALIKKKVFKDIPYPQYVYHQALDHNNTFSEDLDFCRKAREMGHSIWLDTTIQCKHIGQRVFEFPDLQTVDIQQRLREIGQQDLLPKAYVDYMNKLKKEGTEPKVIYDIGACVLHWTNKAREIWPDAYYFVVEGMLEVEELYKQSNVNYACGTLLGSEDGKEVEYYQNLYHPGGNSIYQENPAYSQTAPQLFPEESKQKRHTVTLDTMIAQHNLPQPDLIKIDVQGAELDVLRGAIKTLENCTDVFVESQFVEYNLKAPGVDEVSLYLAGMGFELVDTIHKTDVDGDLHFRRIK